MTTPPNKPPATPRAAAWFVEPLSPPAVSERQVREHCALVCDHQAAMLDKGGDPVGAAAARLCASVLRALTPSKAVP